MDIEKLERDLERMTDYELYAFEAMLHNRLIRLRGSLPPDQIPKISKGECKRIIKYIRQNQTAFARCDPENMIDLIRNVWMVRNDD